MQLRVGEYLPDLDGGLPTPGVVGALPDVSAAVPAVGDLFDRGDDDGGDGTEGGLLDGLSGLFEDTGSDLDLATVVTAKPTLYAVAGVTLALLAGVRVALGSVMSGPHPITWIALSGGFLGGAVMAELIDLGIDAAPAEMLRLRGLEFAHLLYGSLVGAAYPWLYNIVWSSGDVWFVTFPQGLHSAQSLATLMFVVAGFVYLAIGTIGGVGSNLRQWGAIYGMYMAYGIVLGVWVGLSQALWYALLGI